MEKSKEHYPSSPIYKMIDNIDDFYWPSDEEPDFEADPVPAKSPIRSAVENIVANTVLSALTSAVSNEHLIVATVAKSVLTGASTSLRATVGGVAVGALIAGGIYAYNKLKNKSPLEIIKSLSPRHQKQLLGRLAKGLKGLGVRNMAEEIINRRDVRNAALDILSNFLSDKYDVKLVRN